MKILITGSTGFVGKHLLKKLLENKKYVVLELTRDLKKSQKLFGENTQKIDVNDINFSEKIAEFNPNCVIHLASYLTSSDKIEDNLKLIDSNLVFLTKVLHALSNTDISLFINTGTFAEYLHEDNVLMPAYFYAATKTASRYFVSYYANAYDFKFCSVIPSTIYGEDDSKPKIIDLILDSTINNIKMDLSPGEQILDFIHVSDVVNFYITLLNNQNKIMDTDVFKIGSGKGNSLRGIANLVENITKSKTNINWGAKPYRKSDVMRTVVNISKLKEVFNWEPKVSIKEGVISLIEFKKNN